LPPVFARVNALGYRIGRRTAVAGIKVLRSRYWNIGPGTCDTDGGKRDSARIACFDGYLDTLLRSLFRGGRMEWNSTVYRGYTFQAPCPVHPVRWRLPHFSRLRPFLGNRQWRS
jgi:hypothetical protein